MLTYSVFDAKINLHTIQFPAGEVGVRIDPSIEHAASSQITARIKNSSDIMLLLLTVDAMRRLNPTISLNLYLPYIPYARQDRVCVKGEALSIAVFASLINGCKFESVTVLDPHSHVASALIHNVKVLENTDVFLEPLSHISWKSVWLVAPDAGAYKKTYEWARVYGAAGVYSCNKIRELSTGTILSLTTDAPADLSGKHIVIVDDICEGGRTFTEIAGLLSPRKPARMSLIVTHGIFSQGVDALQNWYNDIYTTDSYHGEEWMAENAPAHLTVVRV